MRDVIVIGGGLAGCSMAVQLARRGHGVLLLESEVYPVHKLCGEFLSPEVRGLFRELGVEDEIDGAKPASIRRVAITTRDGREWRANLPGEAIGLSRWSLDPLLFGAATRAGAEGRQGTVVRDVSGTAFDGFTVRFQVDGQIVEERARTVIGAFGKRSRLDRSLGRQAGSGGSEFVAFKMHYRGADLDDWVELHAFDGGYCGMSHVENGLVNVCLIARVSALRDAGRSYDALREGLMRTNAALARRFDVLEPAMDRPVSVSQVSFRTRSTFEGDVVMVGDTAAMIAPLCGDGMAMALRSAAMAGPLVAGFLEGKIAFDELKREYDRSWRAGFRRQLGIGRVLQAGLFRPAVARAGVRLLNAFPQLGDYFVRATRDADSRQDPV
jgi:flavin-dependent dehydrogenase